MSGDTGLVSGIWVLKGLGNEPAVMAAVDGHVWIHTESTLLLDAPISTLTVKFPKIQFDGGCTIESGEQKIRVSFTRPNGAASVSPITFGNLDAIMAAGDIRGAVQKFSDVREGRALGKRWKSVLLP